MKQPAPYNTMFAIYRDHLCIVDGGNPDDGFNLTKIAEPSAQSMMACDCAKTAFFSVQLDKFYILQPFEIKEPKE